MNKDFEKFIKSCFELGNELLDKDSLTQKEEHFLKELDLISAKYIKI